MQLIEEIEKINYPFANAVITIGNFDGVHIGHQSLFRKVREKAAAIEGTSVAMTFDPHPARFLKSNGHPPLITVKEQKIELIAAAGMDVLICVPFNQQFASMPPEVFVLDLLMARIGMAAMIVGRDYSFGRNRTGNLAVLQSLALANGFEVMVADWVSNHNTAHGRISSTRIRELVMEGAVDAARELLGRFYQIRGQVTFGRNRGGRLLGFPTANIRLYDELCPQTGVYAITVGYAQRQYLGVANIGYSPTFDDHAFTIEVHILDFNTDIYGQTIRVNFVKRIRGERKFPSIEALSAQIHADIQVARQILAETTSTDPKS